VLHIIFHLDSHVRGISYSRGDKGVRWEGGSAGSTNNLPMSTTLSSPSTRATGNADSGDCLGQHTSLLFSRRVDFGDEYRRLGLVDLRQRRAGGSH
jgi:hypothetical protein